MRILDRYLLISFYYIFKIESSTLHYRITYSKHLKWDSLDKSETVLGVYSNCENRI